MLCVCPHDLFALEAADRDESRVCVVMWLWCVGGRHQRRVRWELVFSLCDGLVVAHDVELQCDCGGLVSLCAGQFGGALALVEATWI